MGELNKMVKINFIKTPTWASQLTVIGLNSETINLESIGLTKATKISLENIINKNKLDNELDNTLTIISNFDMEHQKVLLINIKDIKEEDFECAGGKIYSKIEKTIGKQKESTIEIIFPPAYQNINDNICKIASGILLKSWSFHKYKSQKKEKSLEINIVSSKMKNQEKILNILNL